MIRSLAKIGCSFTIAALLLGCGAKPVASNVQKGSNKKATELTEKERRQFAGLFLDASKAKILGNYELAVSLYNQALSVNPESDAAQYDLARIYADNGQFSQSINYAKKAYAIDPDNMWYAEFLGRLYAETADYPASLDVFRGMVAKHPEQVPYYYQLGGILSAQGKYDEAIKLYNDLEKRTGPNEELSLQKQLLYIEKGEYELAMQEVNKLIAINPDAAQLYGMKAEIYERQGKRSDAIRVYEELLVVEPSNGLALLSLYELLLAENPKKANEYLERAFAAPDLNIDVKVNILLSMLNQPPYPEQEAQVTALAEKLEVAHGNEAKTFAIQGDILFNYQHFEEARTKFRRAVEIDPNRPPIWQQILSIDSQLGDFAAMRAESEKAIELFPEFGLYYLFNGIALQEEKKFTEAIDALETGKNLVVDNNALAAQFYASLGDIYHQTNEHGKSDKAYEESIKYEPNNAVVLNNYAYYLSLRNANLEKAEAMAKKANDLSPDVASFQDTYGWVLYTRANYQNALFWIEQSLKNGSATDHTVLDHYGDVLYQLNRKPEAAAAWQKSIDAGGDQTELNQKIERTKAP